LEAQVANLKQAKAQAISDGDGERANQLDDALDVVKEQKQVVDREVREMVAAPASQPATDSPQIDPDLQAWLGDNPWFGQDKALTDYTNARGAELRVQYPHLTGKAFLNKLDETLQDEMPKKFKKKEKPMNPVESGAGKGNETSKSVKGWNSLPDDAKAACNRYMKQGLIKTREEYIAMYNGEA
jgi:hypothetical protein